MVLTVAIVLMGYHSSTKFIRELLVVFGFDGIMIHTGTCYVRKDSSSSQ